MTVRMIAEVTVVARGLTDKKAWNVLAAITKYVKDKVYCCDDRVRLPTLRTHEDRHVFECVVPAERGHLVDGKLIQLIARRRRRA